MERTETMQSKAYNAKALYARLTVVKQNYLKIPFELSLFRKLAYQLIQEKPQKEQNSLCI